MLTENTTTRTDPTEPATPAEPRRANRKKRQTPRANQRLLTGIQIENEYGIPYRSVYDLHVDGKLPAIRFTEGGRLWFRREDIEALIERSKTA